MAGSCVARVLDIWSVHEPPDHISTGWKVQLEDGREVVVLNEDHLRWFLVS